MLFSLGSSCSNKVSLRWDLTLLDVTSCGPRCAGRRQPVSDRAQTVQLQPQSRLAAASSLVPITQRAPARPPLRVDVCKHMNAALQTARVPLHL